MRPEHDDDDDGGLAVVRIKPLGAGGGGCERSATSSSSSSNSVGATLGYRHTPPSVTVRGRKWDYPRHVIPPAMGQRDLFDQFMPSRIDGFFDGFNVNIMAYGQTGSGKTHTVFGTPGVMARAAVGEFGEPTRVVDDYGLFPRALIAIYERLQDMRVRDAGRRTYVLTASAVEMGLSGMEDMVDKSHRGEGDTTRFWGVGGVNCETSAKPPRLFGQKELPLESARDLLRVFAAIAVRNTAGTGMNDSSSRSHCFVYLTLYTYDCAGDSLLRNRFQFVDLAGSERLKEAHSGATNWRAGEGGEELINGLITNYSLMTLSQAVRDIIAAQRSRRAWVRKGCIGDLVPLLEESLTGRALTAVFVCLSQAPDNATQSSFALGFGEVFSRLSIDRRRQRPVAGRGYLRKVKGVMAEAKGVLARGGAPRYVPVRKAQVRNGVNQLAVLERLGCRAVAAAKGGGGGGGREEEKKGGDEKAGAVSGHERRRRRSASSARRREGEEKGGRRGREVEREVGQTK